MYSLLLLACAAPVPPPPKALCTDALIGLWDYQYGHQENGLMWLQSNGIYFSRHSPEAQGYYWGLWWVDRNRLHLWEYSYFPESADRKWGIYCNRYQFDFDLTNAPFHYAGKTNYGSKVLLSGRREPETDWLPPLWDTDN